MEDRNMTFNFIHPGCNNWIAVTVFLFLSISSTCSQTVNIAAGTPREGARYELDCLISSDDITGNDGFLWVKDGSNIGWSQNREITNLDRTGSYGFQEYRDNSGTYHFKALIAQYNSSKYGGEYTCILADGTYDNFNTITQAHIVLSSSSGVNQPTAQTTTTMFASKRTLPLSDSPTCVPANDLHALVYTDSTITCLIKINTDNSIIQMGIYEVGGSNSKVSANIKPIDNEYNEVTYSFTARPEQQYSKYQCQVVRSVTGAESCDFGEVQIKLFQEHITYVTEGQNATFTCVAGLHTEIEWSSDPQIQSNRFNTIEPSLLQITHVELGDNGTQVTCAVIDQPTGKELQDTATLIVIPLENSTVYTTNGIEEITEPNTMVSTAVIATAEPPYSMPFNETTLYILAAVGGAFVVLILVAICVAVCLRCRKSDKEDNVSEDNKPTRISTGYVWDRELSQKVHESPMPSPRLSERNPHHASAVKGLQNKEKANGISPSLAYALSHLSDDEVESDTDTLKPGRDRDASVPSNTYVKVAHDAPSGPAPPPPTHNNDIPTYATPDKGRIKDSSPLYASADEVTKKNDRVSIPTLDPQYAIVRPDPENPIVRALSEKQNGAVNAAYRSDEETGET